uniref:Uncharacterized protein n=1 Tax=Anguilla anguilla TaxID=7936 RepID=A0A0E9T5S8_ANGAN
MNLLYSIPLEICVAILAIFDITLLSL